VPKPFPSAADTDAMVERVAPAILDLLRPLGSRPLPHGTGPCIHSAMVGPLLREATLALGPPLERRPSFALPRGTKVEQAKRASC
jgi:hypothetical protein